MRPQPVLMGAGLAMLVLAGPVAATPAAGVGDDASAAAVLQHQRLAQRNDNKWLGNPDPDPGGLPGYRKEAPEASAPAARPMEPQTRGGPKFHKSAPSDSETSASSKRKNDKKDDSK